MRSPVFQRILDNTPKDVEIFVRLYADIVVRINYLLKEKGYNQKDLAEKLDKKPSEISKWLKGNHNFTLRSIAKLETELGGSILYVPRQVTFKTYGENKATMIVQRNDKINTNVDYQKAITTDVSTPNKISNAG